MPIKINMNKKIVDLKRIWDDSEPMTCENNDCSEYHNGLMHHQIKFSNNFVFSLWLCKKCSKRFEKTLKGKPLEIRNKLALYKIED